MTDTLTFHNESQITRLSPQGVLRIRNLRLLWIGEGISLLRDQFYLIALPWLLHSIHLHQPLLVINAIKEMVEKVRRLAMLEIK